VRTSLLSSTLVILLFPGFAIFSASRPQSQDPTLPKPETVMATFHVIAGKEADFQQVLVREWEAYTKEKLVFDQPHVVVRGKETDGKTYFVDIFTWVSQSTPDHPPASVVAVWQSMGPLVEARNGHPSMEITEVQLVVPKN
jgi:hypothetical protein